jgi:hypothetical protein
MSNSKHVIVHAVTNYKDEHEQPQTRWTRIGAVFPNGKGGARIVTMTTPTWSRRRSRKCPAASTPDEQTAADEQQDADVRPSPDLAAAVDR